MRLYFLLLASTLFTQIVLAQGERLIKPDIFIDPSPPQSKLDSAIFYGLKNVVLISFMEGFNDSVFVYRNGKCIDSLYLVTNESIGLAGTRYIPYNSECDVIDLTILFKRSGDIIQERVKLSFKHLEIRRIKTWGLYYSNHFPRLE